MSISIRRMGLFARTPGLLAGLALVLLQGFLFSLPAGAETFAFKYRKDQTYRILSTVKQEVLVNRQFQYRADQLNRLLVTLKDVKDGKGFHHLEYQNSVENKTSNGVFGFDRSYSSEFWRDAQGNYEIDPSYFVPTVLEVPWFPARDIAVGDTWSHAGTEIHDLRQGFEIKQPFRFTMPVSYEYVGPVTVGGKTFLKVLVTYNIWFQPKAGQGGVVDVVGITGFSRQTHYWDPLWGRSDHYDETYSIALELDNGDTYEFRGTADGRVIDNSQWKPDEALQDIRQNLDQLNLKDVSLRKTDEGITISLENIQFMPDSSVLMDSEKEKLRKIGALLGKYPDRDLLVSGHTALAGTPGGRKALSEERARVVAQFLLDLGVRSRDQVMFQGKGSDEPLADNATPEGMTRNRRVEITIRDR